MVGVTRRRVRSDGGAERQPVSKADASRLQTWCCWVIARRDRQVDRSLTHSCTATRLGHLDLFKVTQVRGQIEDGEVAHFQAGLKVGFRVEDGQRGCSAHRDRVKRRSTIVANDAQRSEDISSCDDY
jgi:hypothetical protein